MEQQHIEDSSPSWGEMIGTAVIVGAFMVAETAKNLWLKFWSNF